MMTVGSKCDDAGQNDPTVVERMSSDSGHRDLEVLYGEHADAMHRAAARVLRGTRVAHRYQDAVQDAVVSLMSRWPTGKVENWEAFLVSVARRKALDILKSADVRHPDFKPVEEHDPLDEDDVAETVTSVLDQDRVVKAAREKLSLLPDRDRFVLEQYKALGRSGSDVAAELGISPGRVSQIATLALKTMERMLKEEGVTW